MVEKFKFGKISIVFFLTALIWVWADLAQDDRLELLNVAVGVAKSSDPALWMSFVVKGVRPDLQTSVALNRVVLKGSASRIAEVKRQINTGELTLDLFLVPERDGLAQEGDSTRDMLEFLRQNDQIRQLGLAVESCEPRTLTVRLRNLVRKNVPVECVGLDPSVQVSTIEPSQVEAFVPEDEALKAIVQLTSAEQNQAKNAPIEKTPYVELAPQQRRELATKVKIKLAAAEKVLSEYSVSPATLGMCFSQNLQGKYQVVLENSNDPALASVLIKATQEARNAYYAAPYQMMLHIHDPDRVNPTVEREVVFTFPEDYVRKDEIRANQRAPVVKFRLVPVPAPEVETPGL